MAPTPARANGHSEPTPKNLVVTAMPSIPLAASRATMEKVMVPSPPSEAWVERVTEPVADQVQAEHGQEDHKAREEREPRRFANELAAEAEHRAPCRRRGLGAEAKETERGLGEDGVGQRQ